MLRQIIKKYSYRRMTTTSEIRQHSPTHSRIPPRHLYSQLDVLLDEYIELKMKEDTPAGSVGDIMLHKAPNDLFDNIGNEAVGRKRPASLLKLLTSQVP